MLLSIHTLKWYEEEFIPGHCVYFKHYSLEKHYSVLTLGMSNSIRLKLEASDRVICAQLLREHSVIFRPLGEWVGGQ